MRRASAAVVGLLIAGLLPPASAAAAVLPMAKGHHGTHVRNLAASATPIGLTPAQIKAAYGFSTSPTAGAGKTIAIVDAYDDPSAEDDLAVFDQAFGLPACTTANGCFKKVSQSGTTKYPAVDSGWAVEISLDVQWAHAIAPGAKILLVEATSASLGNLLSAENYAKTHAQYVSNSWGTGEFSLEGFFDGYFKQTGVSFFAASGDGGTPAIWPATSPNVIAVGGTTLTLDAGGNVASETGWAGSGGGCSAYERATTAQSGFGQYAQVNCKGKRATPDVALDADPVSGVAVYDSVPSGGSSGWWQVGGTSASAPMWAARSAVAGTVVNAAYVYGGSITYRDITSGSNGGATCLPGFDLVTGRGSWTDSTP